MQSLTAAALDTELEPRFPRTLPGDPSLAELPPPTPSALRSGFQRLVIIVPIATGRGPFQGVSALIIPASSTTGLRENRTVALFPL